MSLPQVLETCEAALKRADPDAAAAALLAGWRELPYVELADALDRFPSRPASSSGWRSSPPVVASSRC